MYLEDKKLGGFVETKIELWRQRLLEAAEELRNRDWCQHTLGFYTSNSGPVCAVGALFAVHYRKTGDVSSDQPWEDAKLVSDFLSVALPNWNDTPGRTKEEVINAFEQCAKAGL